MWNEITYLFPNFNGCTIWSLGMDKLLHAKVYWAYDYLPMLELQLTHWGWVTHVCISKLPILGSDNGLSPGRRQAII